jgi:hypothetical protein
LCRKRLAMSKSKCFANRHMTPEEYALWDVSRQISHQTGTLYFDGRAMATQFAGTSKSRIYRLAKRLLDKGWYELIAPRVRDKRTGLFSSTQYRVLSPDEWAERHPHVCAVSSPQNGTGIQSSKWEHPVPKLGMTSPQNGTYIVKENIAKEKRYDTAALKAAQSAYSLFCQDWDEQDAFRLLLWTLYRAASAGQIPQTLDYYEKADVNFRQQYDGADNILDSADDRFEKHACRFIEAHDPNLLHWLEETSKRLEQTVAANA